MNLYKLYNSIYLPQIAIVIYCNIMFMMYKSVNVNGNKYINFIIISLFLLYTLLLDVDHSVESNGT